MRAVEHCIHTYCNKVGRADKTSLKTEKPLGVVWIIVDLEAHIGHPIVPLWSVTIAVPFARGRAMKIGKRVRCIWEKRRTVGKSKRSHVAPFL